MSLANDLTAFTATAIRLGRGIGRRITAAGRPDPPHLLELYDFEGCPYYVIPDAKNDGVKAAIYHGGEITTPDRLRREVAPEEVTAMRRVLAETVPPLNGALRKTAACMYTNTPDLHFAIGALPSQPDVIVASPCSGHGFKFAAVVGEIVADLAAEGRTRHPIGLFGLDRFTRPRG